MYDFVEFSNMNNNKRPFEATAPPQWPRRKGHMFWDALYAILVAMIFRMTNPSRMTKV